ncbi:MAG: AMP-binding protein [Bacteroidia bacterium]
MDEVFYFDGTLITADHADACPEKVKRHFEAVREITDAWQQGRQQFTLNTSGSTGPPKTIRFSREALTRSAEMTAEVFDLGKGITALLCLSAEYVAGFMMAVRAQVNGWKLIVVPPSSNPLLHLPPGISIDFAAFIPMQMQAILRGSGQSVRMLQNSKLIIGGGAVSAELEDTIRKNRITAWHTYGMTETLTHVAIRKLGPDKTETAFIPLPGVAISVDENNCLALTVPALNGQSVQTRDRVELQEDGRFIWLGRLDNVANSGGHKVQLEKVEAAVAFALNKLKLETDDFFAAAIPDAHLGEMVVVFLNKKINVKNELIKIATEKLHRYEVPKEIIEATKWKKTASGKVDKQAIRLDYLNEKAIGLL